MLIGSAIFGFIALAGNFVSRSSVTDLVIYSTVFVILLLTILIRFPYWLKASVLLILIYAIILSDFWDEGIWGGGRLYMVVLVVMASILFSPRGGIIALIISTVTTAIGGWLILTGQVQLTSAGIPTGILSDWISAGLTDILVGAVLIIGLRLVQSEFERARELAGSAIWDVEEQSKIWNYAFKNGQMNCRKNRNFFALRPLSLAMLRNCKMCQLSSKKLFI